MNESASGVGAIQQLMLHSELERLRAEPRYRDPRHLVPYGAKAYCQCDEDGIIAEIFRRIGTKNKSFVEFGIGNGLENNTHALLFDDWKGLWIEASSDSIAHISNSYADLIKSGQLTAVESFITRENIDGLIKKSITNEEIDLLSIDLDGNDYHILSAIQCVNPRVLVLEYNAKFFPPLMFCMDYDAGHYWRVNDCFGASLKFLEVKMKARGYILVGCNLSGANAFFIRSDLVSDKFLDPYTAEQHYEPARYYLIEVASGHTPSYDTLANSLTMRNAARS